MTLREFLRVSYQHKLLIVVFTLLAGAGAFLLAIRETPRYQASALVLLSDANVPSILTNTANPNANAQPDRIATTQAQLARVPTVARRALAIAGLDDRTPEGLIRASSVTADPTSDLLTFTVRDDRSGIAERLATAYAQAYVRYRYTVDSAPYVSANRNLVRRLAQLQAAGRTDSRLYDDLTSQQQQLQSLITLQTSNARVVKAAADASKIQPRPVRALAIGLPIGLLLGIVLSLLAHVLDTRARTLVGVGSALGIGALGWAPRPPRRFRHRLVMVSDPTSDYGESFTSLRTGVDLARRVHGGDVLLVTPLSRRTPGVKSTVVANLAVSFARGGLNVVLVDLDLRQPSLARLFGLKPANGLTEVLLGRTDVHGALVNIPLQAASQSGRKRKELDSVEFGGTLQLLPVATRPANPTDVLATRGVGVILEQLRSEADLVLIDAPPLLEGSDVAALSMHVDALAVIVELGHDRRGHLAEARRRLAASSATVLGFIGSGKEDGAGYSGDRFEVHDRLEAVR
ncbi:MAG TPA: Wzz/FepE/Etk N-terminal domain-containing protein [Gaiellaceae bacterium]|nr:Wzz/FepE/Etk N-terminal domain-containing protein [Gaiellaceae bacterium]